MSAQQDFDPRDRKKYYLEETPPRRFLLWLVYAFFRTAMVMNVEGLENFPLDGPVIIAANHLTNFDVFPMQFALPRTICYMGKAELFNTPLDPLLRVLCAFPVNRGEKDEWALRHAHKVLAHRQTLGMFPEGTRSKGRGLSVAKTGTARLALEANCPIIPMAVIGTDKFFKKFLRRAKVTIKLLPPILPHPNDTPLSLTDRLMFSLAAGLPGKMRGVYADVPKGFEKVR
jgi:1-acyl-sn-glycerol-3-phosphate acyltransferase